MKTSSAFFLSVVSSFLLAACGNSAAPAGSGATPPPITGGDNKLTVVVLVVDSLMQEDIGAQTPTLQSLIDGGTLYTESRSVFSAETIPNHVAMMTGVYPDRNGIPTNNFIDFAGDGEEKDLSVPEQLSANTMFTWINKQCRDSDINPDIKHAAVLSKKYLYEIFSGDAFDATRENVNSNVFNAAPDDIWDPTSHPTYIGPGSEHTPDPGTMQEVLSRLPDADFIFINLGDVDRSAHAGGEGARMAVISDTDTQISMLVNALETAGRWQNTVMLLVSDHGMDFTLPGPIEAITTQPALDQLATCFTDMQAVQNGGTNSIYISDRALPLAQKQAALRAARQCLMGVQDCDALCAGTSRPANADSIDFGWYTRADALDTAGNMPASIRSMHPNLGDLVLVAGEGAKFSEPNQSGNPIPGNHGHIATIRNFTLVTGGSEWVKKGQTILPSVANPTLFDRLPEQSENIDVAATVSWLLGLNIPASAFPDSKGFDGRILGESFTQFNAATNPAAPTRCGRF